MSLFGRLHHLACAAVTLITVLRLATAVTSDSDRRECGHSEVMLAMAACHKERQKLSTASQAAHNSQLCRDLQRYSDCLEPRIQRCHGSAKTAFDVITERYSRHPYNCKLKPSYGTRKEVLHTKKTDANSLNRWISAFLNSTDSITPAHPGSTFGEVRGGAGNANGTFIKPQMRRDTAHFGYPVVEEGRGVLDKQATNSTTDTAERNNNKTTTIATGESESPVVEGGQGSSLLTGRDNIDTDTRLKDLQHKKTETQHSSRKVSSALQLVETNSTGTAKAKRQEDIEAEGEAAENIADKMCNNRVFTAGYVVVFLLSYLYI